MKIIFVFLFGAFLASCSELNDDERPPEPISEKEEISLTIEDRSVVVESEVNLWEREFILDDTTGSQPLLQPTCLVVQESNSFYFNLFNNRLLALDMNSGELIGDFLLQNILFGLNDTVPRLEFTGSNIIFSTARKVLIFNHELSLEMDVLKRIESLELHEIGAYRGDTIDLVNVPMHVIKGNPFFSDEWYISKVDLLKIDQKFVDVNLAYKSDSSSKDVKYRITRK